MIHLVVLTLPHILSNESIVLLLAIGGLFAFGKNIIEATLRLHAYAKTKSGQATLLVTCLGLCLATFLVILLSVS